MKIILTLILSASLLRCFSQEIKTPEKILYIIDSIPVIDDPDEGSGTLNNDEIDNVTVVTTPAKIKELGYADGINKVIFVTTKEYLKRPDALKKIPSTKIMERKKGVCYLKKDGTPYTGKFIDYFLNGKIQGEGEFKNGKLNGLLTIYHANGNKSYFRNYVNGIAEGYSEEYFLNGVIKQKGTFKNNQDEGLWIEFYSTGAIKRQTTFINLKPQLTKNEEKFYSLQDKGIELMKTDDHAGAVKKLDQAQKLNPNYADVYFYRGTANLNLFDFDNAVNDFNKAIELEPLYVEALSNRAFARLRKYQFKDSRTLSKTSQVTVLAAKDVVNIPEEEKRKICTDLNKAVELGDTKEMILDALKNYCNK